MKVVHLSHTPVAGSPGNIVSALNRHTDIAARHVVYDAAAYASRTFAVDLDWQRHREEALDVIAAADVIHVHQIFPMETTFGADFPNRFGNKRWIRQFHSAPELWCRDDAVMRERIINDPLPQLVIGQGPERFYPFARVVPNIVPIDDARYLPKPESPGETGRPLVVFSPSGASSGWRKRWETKGAPQTLRLLRRLERRGLCEVRLIMGVPHDECLRLKQRAAVALDECVTGNYHLSGLEALSQGKPTLGHLDNRVQSQLRRLTGACELPWVDVPLEAAEAPLVELLESASLRAQIGAASRRWMETHYRDAAMVQYYRQAYLDLFNAPHRFGERRIDAADQWLGVSLPNLRWRARRNANAFWRGLWETWHGR
ncbi:glycosyltransferase family 1 protein [Pandoraea fibrosis]|uniref:Glycosyltransferase family 1 protein n=1 Tax=Pandoraea fibrosis TaxID=1891094 RepID=A0A5E4YY37_9BURK|nr:glycosyltransferase family 1 protein [Pandoraea fibrosis]QHE93727.1 glycosyltransferase family 1 protein [Pandoraea fibrosis]QHF12711.1 glycosyltransferase family 1 protein [Pandoraea fibrosis]VVE53706.1 hypothetical protein PFI31113_04848 [Pandoraea fibrosis]